MRLPGAYRSANLAFYLRELSAKSIGLYACRRICLEPDTATPR